ncbi:MAG TPA: tetratricopeptide repeat protein [Stellaceae bacterium]|nr:tetratricopeptide repeat protein [Stellaceae bacterium]
MLLQEAWAATAAQAWDRAAACWKRLRADHPERWEGHVWPVHTLWLAGRLDEAQRAATAALRRFPDIPELLRLRAVVATTRRDWDEALRLWQAWRTRFPDDPDGYVWALRIASQNRRALPREIAAEAAARFPGDAEVLSQLAWQDMAEQRWEDALAWWTRVRDAAPDQPDGYVWASQALRQTGRLDEAETLASAAVARFPALLEALVEHAQVATARREYDAALRRWAAVRGRFPDHAEAQIAPLTVLRLAGRRAEAEALAAELLQRFPENDTVILEELQIAANGDAPDAVLRRLAEVRGLVEETGRMEAGLGWLEYRVRLQGADAPHEAPARGPTARPAARPAAPSAAGLAPLMLAFESLGERCDFGAVQRKFGVEPLGLLRFALAPYEGLLAALADGFAAIGTEDDTVLGSYLAEHMIEMQRYELTFHTCVYQHELSDPAELATFRRQQLRRLAFLKRKLLADLAEAEKIFVYSHPLRAGEADARALFDALGRYGRNALLYVRPASERHAAGTVLRVEERLFLGHVERFTRFGAGELPPFDTWRRLCETTLRLAGG